MQMRRKTLSPKSACCVVTQLRTSPPILTLFGSVTAMVFEEDWVSSRWFTVSFFRDIMVLVVRISRYVDYFYPSGDMAGEGSKDLSG